MAVLDKIKVVIYWISMFRNKKVSTLEQPPDIAAASLVKPTASASSAKILDSLLWGSSLENWTHETLVKEQRLAMADFHRAERNVDELSASDAALRSWRIESELWRRIATAKQTELSEAQALFVELCKTVSINDTEFSARPARLD